MDILEAQQFLVSCTASLILHHGLLEHEGKKATLQEIVMVRLGSFMLKNVANFESCLSLRICILADNFITNIAALSECAHLVKLDLSGNQITQLPDVDFWKRFKKLQLLNLHDNNMSTRQHVIGLSGCPNLYALTLNDTPLSLRGSYRHCIVNSLWSLKALDKYVIADEEIIEGFTLTPKFKKMTPNLAVDLHPASKMEPFKIEMKLVVKIISKINQIQAMYSPTLVIQKWIRGHLTRKTLNITSTIWHWRVRKRQLSPIISEATSEDTSYSDKQPALLTVPVVDKHKHEQNKGGLNMKLVVNLLADTEEGVCEEQALSATDDKKLKSCFPPTKTPQHNNVLRLGTPEDKVVKDMSDEMQKLALEMTGIHTFGYKAMLHQADPVTDMLLSRQQVGKDVQGDISHFHTQKPSPKKPLRPRFPMITAEHRLIDHCHAGINLEVSHIIERGHRARERDVMHRKRAEHVVQARARRKEAREHRDVFIEGCREKVLLRREQEQVELQDTLLRLKARQNQEIQLVKERYALFLERKKLQREEQAKVDDLCCRHISLCKVIASQSTREWRNIMLQERQSLTTSIRAHAARQKKRVQKYFEHRKQFNKESARRYQKTLETYKETLHNNLMRAAKVRAARIKASNVKTAARISLVLEKTHINLKESLNEKHSDISQTPQIAEDNR